MIYLSTAQAAALLGVSARTVQLKIKNNELTCVKKGRGYQVPLNALPQAAQVEYIKSVDKKELTEKDIADLAPEAQMACNSAKISVGLENLAREKRDKHQRDLEIWQTIQGKPPSVPMIRWAERLSAIYGVSEKSIYRIAKQFTEKGVSRAGRGTSSWDPEAVTFLQGYYLKAIREVGDCTKLSAYRAVKEKAQIEGWQIGSRSSAYHHLSNLSPLLETYSRGGNLALDNYFYILRDLDSLDPMQVIVGDQHRFDWWVKDDDGSIIRPECYLWIDMCTRMPYGIAFDRKYSSQTVKLSLHMGMLRFGKFGTTYNDNGKPELSKAMNEVIAELQSYGMGNEDISNMYKSPDGYVVTDDDDNVLSLAKTPEDWKRENRRLFAKVKNAKAKPIERFFRTYEQVLVDSGIPGRIKSLTATAPEEEEAKKRLKKQEKDLLTYTEFIVAAITALETYETRTHQSLKMSPRDKLMQKYKAGWRPTFINEVEVDFIFLNRSRRKVNRGRILIEGTSFVGEEIKTRKNGQLDESVGIQQYEGKVLQVRYNPHDLEKAYAIAPDGSVRPLYRARHYEMLNDGDASDAMQWKRRQMAAVKEAYSRLTSGIAGLTVTTAAHKSISDAAKAQQNELPKLKQAEMDKLMEDRRAEQKKITRMRPVAWESNQKRYQWCLDSVIQGYSLSAQDKTFMRTYNEGMSDEERAYWNMYKAIGGNSNE